MRKNDLPRSRLAALFVPTAIALAACGSSDDTPAPAPSAGAAAALTLAGTAATGAAIAGGAVDAKCNGGSGSATTGADGGFAIELAQGALPCVLRVTAGATVLHSIATGSGASARANLTPVSDMVLASLAGSDPAAYFGAFDPAAGAPAAAQIEAALAAVNAALQGGGIDLSATDVLAGALAAASGSTPGDAFDQALDALQTRLAAAGLTLADLRDTLVRESPAAPRSALSGTPSLPSAMLLRPAASNCKALRSGSYRTIDTEPDASGGTDHVGTAIIDAERLTWTETPSGEVVNLVPNGDCRYTDSAEGYDVVVSPAGVIVIRYQPDAGVNQWRMAIAFPEQQHTLAILAGEWNTLGLATGAMPELFSTTPTVDGSGAITHNIDCFNLTQCRTSDGNGVTLAAHADGGFTAGNATFSERVFVYRSGSGEPMFVALGTNGGVEFGTRQRTVALSPVGTVNRTWNLALTGAGTVPSGFGDSENTTVSHAGDGSSWTRNAVIDFATGVTRPETVQINQTRDGYIHRVPETVTASNGAASNVAEWIGLPLRGIGITPVAIVANRQLVLSVAKP